MAHLLCLVPWEPLRWCLLSCTSNSPLGPRCTITGSIGLPLLMSSMYLETFWLMSISRLCLYLVLGRSVLCWIFYRDKPIINEWLVHFSLDRWFQIGWFWSWESYTSCFWLLRKQLWHIFVRQNVPLQVLLLRRLDIASPHVVWKSLHWQGHRQYNQHVQRHHWTHDPWD